MSNYGNDDEAYAAQVMMRTYRPGMDVGNLGDVGGNYGFDASWIGPAIQGVSTVVGAGVQAGAAGRAGKYGLATAEAQAEAAAEHARLAALGESSKGERTKTIAIAAAGTLVFLGVLGVGAYVWVNRDE